MNLFTSPTRLISLGSLAESASVVFSVVNNWRADLNEDKTVNQIF